MYKSYKYIPFRNMSSINVHCKLIKDLSLIVERLSGAFHFQPIQFAVAFSSVNSIHDYLFSAFYDTIVRHGSILNGWKSFTKFNPGVKRNNFYYKSTARSRWHTVGVRTRNIWVTGLYMYKLVSPMWELASSFQLLHDCVLVTIKHAPHLRGNDSNDAEYLQSRF